mmetsp:Transcript_31003/g.35323  ORF Transcript_31003/g.35323 Transcript_31003/m.35323 type:complete len:513 (-) Transcript_31003:144-1682(-)|eukprot:CAMPEP_0194134114 /NCGR_PEP_ID=MMETSP0152-20130528/4175_1 /TAXON_ID=1049557 /ORGANISM="Thalassiothrix antarctica, Strain L6-D1" /LENGTH=512 /DNA_ID=CAMNT_0038829671 /DNA_START=280 /DNA_END=1818 /DNA_ORIENTATION=+
MGGCLSSKEDYIPNNNGGEEDYHSRFLEDKKILGEGQFGVVKLVHDMQGEDEELLACKTLHKGIVFKDNVLYTPLKPQVLKNECEILRTLGGKQFCLDLIAIYETPKFIYVVTELCSGGEMMEYVSNQESLTTGDFSRVAFQLLSAVDHCAEESVIHRDIKPENTMFRDPSPGAQLRLIDFGSGAIDKDEKEGHHTTRAGTAFYNSPEMFQLSYTSKTDVWSCGVTLYVLVAGYPATNLQKAFDMLQISKRDLRNLPGMPEDIPDSFIDLLDKLLVYNYRHRPSAGDLLDHDFVQFHKKQSKTTTLISDIIADSKNATIQTVGKEKLGAKPLSNNIFNESIKKHTIFVRYLKYERSVTTLLATMMFRRDFNALIERLDKEYEISHPNSKSETATFGTKLQVITIRNLKKILTSMNQKECVEQIWKFPNAASYENFAFNIALLKQFKYEDELDCSRRHAGKLSHNNHDLPSSVHGSNVFRNMSRRGVNKKGKGSSRGGLSSNADQLSNSVQSY